MGEKEITFAVSNRKSIQHLIKFTINLLRTRLSELHDNYPKYILTTDEFSGGNYEGIKAMSIADFLLSTEW